MTKTYQPLVLSDLTVEPIKLGLGDLSCTPRVVLWGQEAFDEGFPSAWDNAWLLGTRVPAARSQTWQ
jgi:hypothetical protein